METQNGHDEDEGGPNPCPEDDADLMRPDAEQMEDLEAIGNFMDDMEKQEHGCFTHIHTFLSKLPVPLHTKCRAMSHAPMEDAGVIKLYEQSPTPCLYVAPVENITGRVPLFPLFLAGNSTPTVPHCYSKRKDTGFPIGCADSAASGFLPHTIS